MLHGGDGIRAVVVSRILTQRNRRWRNVGSFSPLRCIQQRRQEHGSLSPSRRRDGLNLHADRTPLPVNQAYQRVPEDGSVISRSSVSVRVWLLPPARARRCGYRHSHHRRFQDIARYMAKPFGTHAEVHGLRSSSSVLISHSPARCACPRLDSQKHPSS